MRDDITKALLICGVLTSALYIGTDLVAGTFLYPGYDYTSQQVSELSAIGSPSRTFWIIMGYPYGLLTVAFAVGVWRAADRLSLRVAAVLIILFAINALAWSIVAPMHMRATEFTDTDTLHIAFATSAVLLMVAFIGFGAASRGRGFRLYSAITVVAMLSAGAIVSTQIAAIAAGKPTPWMGLIERISVYGPTVWIGVFALALLNGLSRSPALGS